MSQKLSSIGTIEAVSLPDHGVENIMAKIDTGADSSSIWASNISEHDGELRFNLFGPTSPYFSGEEVHTRRFSLVTVKNSFGHQEVRYKVSLKLRLADRTIRVRITLANRSANRFPILIGRRTLRGKFLVDVAQRNLPNSGNRCACLLFYRNEANRKFIDSLKKDGIDIESFTYEELLFQTGVEGNRISSSLSGEDLAEFGLVFFGTSEVKGRRYVAASIAEYLEKRHIGYIDRVVIECPEQAKLYQYIKLTDHRIPVPKTLFMLPSRLIQSYERCVAELGLPFILKDNMGRRGKNNHLINGKEDFEREMRRFIDLEIWPLAQQYIPNDYDFRLLVLGGEVALVMKRTRSRSDTHLNNSSQGGITELIDDSVLPNKLVNMAVMSSKLLQLQIAGVDLVQDKHTKSWYCLEVNKSPQLYSGALIEAKEAAVVKYFSHRLLNNKR